MILEKINTPEDIQNLGPHEMHILSSEIRDFLIEKVKKTGGHLASNLGVVELTLALHKTFDFKTNHLIFDVSHQCYVHKILTGRKEGFDSLRQFEGLSGFTDPSESEYDTVKVGHAGASISTGLGLQTGLDMKNENARVVVVIGDASISNGMALEALNHLGDLKKNLIIVLNDNQMSISKTVGAFSRYLSRFLSSSFYNTLKKDVNKLLNKIPVMGKPIKDGLENIRKTVKKNIIPNFFEEMDVNYIGPVDGHQIQDLIAMLENVRKMEGPILLHVLTKKGKGYPEAEANPALFHGISPKNNSNETSFTSVFGNKIVDLGKTYPNLCVITAAMTEGTGLCGFAREFPGRYFDTGIAEEHATAFAGALSLTGVKPYVAIYSTFMQRSLDQLFQEVSLQKNSNPVFIMDRSGLVGEDGPTHHGVFDIAYTRFLPRFFLMSPKDGTELEDMLAFCYSLDAPAVIRFPKGGFIKTGKHTALKPGKAETIQEFPDAAFTLLAYGSMVGEAYLLNEILNIPFNLVNLRFAKPLDEETILEMARHGKPVVTLEEHSLIGGVGEMINSLLMKNRIPAPILNIGLEDRFYPHGKREKLLEIAGLKSEQLAEKINIFLKMQD